MASFRYDDVARDWEIVLPDNMSHRSKSIIVDTPSVARPGRFEFQETTLEVRPDGSRTTIGRKTPLPKGFVNDPCMSEWKLRWNPEQELWVIWREDVPNAVASSPWVDLDCRAESGENGILHCFAEALVDGRTFREGSAQCSAQIYLRTLVVYDQEVAMNLIAISRSTFAEVGG
jgi:hypothetical protein